MFNIYGIINNPPTNIENIQNLIFCAIFMKLLIEIKPETHENATAIISSMNCKFWIPSTNITNKFAKNTAGMLIMNDNLNAVLGLNLLNSK